MSSHCPHPCSKSADLIAKPVLKWAGGKGQLLKQIVAALPTGIYQGEIDRYVEPFIGGGAIFLWISQHCPIQEFYLSDVNQELILLYLTIQKEVNSLIEALKILEKEYFSLSIESRKSYFLEQRRQYNEQQSRINYENFNVDGVSRSAQMIFLNRTCFNGLFRVNQKGEFNVPFGDYRNPRICHGKNLLAVSQLLQKAIIKHQDFTAYQNEIDSQSFVYFDPPYRPLSKTANFKAYARFDFNDREQERLARFYHKLNQQGAKLMLSNSDPHNLDPQDNFFEKLYADFRINKIQANRLINSKASRRGAISELLITNY
jgi:DNA adenine methylase